MYDIGPYKGLLDARESADYLGEEHSTFRTNYQDRKIEPIRLLGRIFFTKESLDAYRARRVARAAQHRRCERAA